MQEREASRLILSLVSVDGMFTWIRSKRGRIGLGRETRWLWSKAY